MNGVELLATDLRGAVRGEVRFDAGSRALNATGGSNYRQVPIGLVVPADVEDAVTAVGVCRDHDAPVLPLGAHTSLAGQSVNVAVVVDFSRSVDRIVELDAERRTARVEPGVVLDTLRGAAERHHLTFAPDPSTHAYCTLGGMIGNNSCGVHSVMGGKTVDNVESLDVLTYDGERLTVGATTEEELSAIVAAGGRRGEIYGALRDLRDRYADLVRARYPRIPRRVSGYNLDELLPENGFHVARALVGTEGTCVTVLSAQVRLVPSPPARTLLVLGYPDVYEAADYVPEVLAAGPIGLEGVDEKLVSDLAAKGIHPTESGLLPDGRGWLLVEFGGEVPEEAEARARELVDRLGRDGPASKVYRDPAEVAKVWEVRESALGATALVPGRPPAYEGWEDAAVAPDRLGAYLRDFRRLLRDYDYQGALYGHFGDGCVHTRIDFDHTTAPGRVAFRRFVEEAADLVAGYGGSLSGEHGDGQARGELLPRMFGPELVRAFGEFKAVWDPAGRMNPHKVVDPHPIDADLRLGPAYRPAPVRTHFRFPDDGGSFAQATRRCVGVGKCRALGGQTMCPSFQVTRDERHTTRGRAHLLFEMLSGDVVTEGWRDPAVKDALDLCLACKGCKGDCPVDVDMATYKAEFLAHYYRGRLRPRSAYAMGLIYWAARAAGHAPGVANAVLHGPGLSRLAKRAAGVAPARDLPRFAAAPFTTSFARRRTGDAGGPRVLLWPDTFTNYFDPHVARAAVRVLEAAGCRVAVPAESSCCGRPLYDYGMLRLAKRQLRQILRVLAPELAAGTPIVVLEPSCLAVFRDELGNLFPGDPDAQRLRAQATTLAGFLAAHRPGWEPPPLRRTALVQRHCHHQAVVGFGPETALLDRLGVDATVLDSGCCGLAGSFGFEEEHYDLSMAIGERVLLPAVRAAGPETLVVADGFSCRTQIAHGTQRRAVHSAELLAASVGMGAR